MTRRTVNDYQLEINLLGKWPTYEHKTIRHLPHSLFGYLGITDASKQSLSKLRTELRKQPRLRACLVWYSNVAERYYKQEAQRDRVKLLNGLTCIDLLEVMPEFRKLVEATRKVFHIDTLANLRTISQKVPIDLFYYANLAKHDSEYFEIVTAPMMDKAREHGLLQPSTEDIIAGGKALVRFEKSFELERQAIIKIFLRKFRLNRSMQQWVYDYVLYDIKQGNILSLSRYKMPLKLVRKDKYGDPYIELRIYDDTDFLGWLRLPGNTGNILETQLSFGLIRESRWQQTIGINRRKQPWHQSKSMTAFLREFAYCQQVLLTGKNNAQTNEYLLNNGLKEVPDYHSAQTIRRYKKRFIL